MVPLLTYIMAVFWPKVLVYAFPISSSLTAIAIFAMGAAKSRVTGQQWLQSGTEMLLIGGAAACVAYYIGLWLKGFEFSENVA